MRDYHQPQILLGVTLLAVSLGFAPSFIHSWSIKEIFLRLGIGLMFLAIPLQLKTIKWDRIDLLLLILFSWQVLSSLINTSWPQSGFKVEIIILAALFYLLARSALRSESSVSIIINSIIVIAVVQSSIGILQYFHAFPPTTEYFTGYESQVTGTLAGANLLGALLAISLPLVFLRIQQSIGKGKALWAIVFLLIVLTLILTKSRGAWIAGLFGTTLYFWVSLSNWVKSVILNKKVSIIIIPIIAGMLGLILVWIYQLNPDSASGRLFIWSVSWDMIRDNLWTGVGYGNFGFHWLEYQGGYFARVANSDLRGLAVSLKSAHSQYLNLSAETGIIGLGLFTALCLSMLTSFKRYSGTLPTEQKQIFLTIFSALVTILVHALVEDVFNSLTVQLIFLMLIALFISIPDVNAKTPTGGLIWKRKWKLVVILPLFVFLLTLSWIQIRGELLWKQGQDLARAGNWEQSIKRYREAGNYLPYNHELDFYLGAAYSKTGQAEMAIKYLTQSQNGFSDKNQYIALGKTYTDNGDYELAEAALSKVLYYYPALLSPHFWLSRVYYEQGDIDRAKQELETILSAENILNSPEIERVKMDARQTLDYMNSWEAR